MRKILIFLTLLWVVFGNVVYAESFDIKNYNIDLSVNQDSSVDIRENIDVYFHENKHGLFRTIPLKNSAIADKGKKYDRYAMVNNIEASHSYNKSYSDGNLVLKLGDSDALVSGLQNYKLKYSYILDNDKLSNKDEFYFNIIGPDWDNNIEKVHFSIEMPKNIDADKVGISVGRHGTIGYYDESLIYRVTGNKIVGDTTRVLAPHEAVTIRIELPEGYFKKSTKKFKSIIMIIFFSVIFTFLAYYIWSVYGKDEKVIPVVNFYPPKGLNSAELGVLYDHDGKADIENVISLIVYLASKGYIKIEDLGDDDFTLTKLKEYDGNNAYEKELMNILFDKGIITCSELKYSEVFYKECDELANKIQQIRSRIFEASSISFFTYILPGVSVIVLFFLLLYSLNNFSFDFLVFDIFSFLISMTMPITLVYLTITNKEIEMSAGFFKRFSYISDNDIVKISIKIGFILIYSMFGINYLSSLTGSFLNITPEGLKIAIIPLIGLVIASVCIRELPKRNNIGIRLLGEILGFKKFIETAEIDKIRMLIDQDPSYGYDILPYAYILGIHEPLLSKLECLMLTQTPDWFNGYDSHSFLKFADTMYLVSSPSVENGGISTSSSGGGGFAGGGCGGGGGGSW